MKKEEQYLSLLVEAKMAQLDTVHGGCFIVYYSILFSILLYIIVVSYYIIVYVHYSIFLEVSLNLISGT